MRLRLLAPAIALIVAATMIPISLRHPSLRHIDYTFDPTDFFNNLLLYLPLGIALGSSSLARTFLCGLSLATIAEGLQLGYIDRVPSPFDIASNTLGAMGGYLAAIVLLRATGHDWKSLRVPRPLAAAGILIAVVGTTSLVRHPPVSDFSNWNPTFNLAVGNELTGDRPWHGTVSEFAIYPFAMAARQINELYQSSRLPPGGLRPPADFAQHAGRPLLSKQDQITWHETLGSRNQLTLLVWMRTSDLEQIGPASIITYSQDASRRNFTLGQIRNTLTFRLRTPASGLNGTSPAIYTGPVLSLSHPSFVAAVYDGRISSLYVDGKRVAQADLGARRPHLSRRILFWLPRSIPLREIELGAAEMLFSSLFTLGIFAFTGVPQRPSMRFLLGMLAGASIGGATWAFGISEASLGTRILLECIAAGLMIAASVENQSAAV
jgi:hypothetical protein